MNLLFVHYFDIMPGKVACNNLAGSKLPLFIKLENFGATSKHGLLYPVLNR